MDEDIITTTPAPTITSSGGQVEEGGFPSYGFIVLGVGGFILVVFIWQFCAHLQKKKKSEEEARKRAEAKHKAEEAKQKAEEVKKKAEEAKRKAEENRRKTKEAKQKVQKTKAVELVRDVGSVSDGAGTSQATITSGPKAVAKVTIHKPESQPQSTNIIHVGQYMLPGNRLPPIQSKMGLPTEAPPSYDAVVLSGRQAVNQTQSVGLYDAPLNNAPYTISNGGGASYPTPLAGPDYYCNSPYSTQSGPYYPVGNPPTTTLGYSDYQGVPNPAYYTEPTQP